MNVFLWESNDHNFDPLLEKILAPINSLLLPGKTVFIKPNLCKVPVSRYDMEMSITNPELICQLALYIKHLGCRVIIGDANSPRPTETVEKIYSFTKLENLSSHGIELINISHDKQCFINDHPDFRYFGLSSAMLAADVIINLCKLKTHSITGYTGALKNLWGAIPRNDRMLLHHKMYKLLFELNSIYKPQLTIMDAVHCMHGRGPTNGKPIDMNLLLSSSNGIALDYIANKLIGFDPKSIKHLNYALLNCEFNTSSIETITDSGKPVLSYSKKFEPAILDLPNRITLYLQRFPFFSHHIVMNDTFFQPVKKFINVLRRIHLLPE